MPRAHRAAGMRIYASRERRLVPWPASKEDTKQMIKHSFCLTKTESTISYTKPVFHNFGSNPLQAELARSGAILVNSL